MTTSLHITHAGFVCASPEERETGLLGWVTCVLNDTLLLDGITLRRTADGRLTLSYPARRDRTGNQHSYIRPLDDAARQHLQQEILKALGSNLEKTGP